MSDSKIEDRLLAFGGWGCAIICVLLGIPAALLASIGFFAFQRSQPPEFDVVRNEVARSWEIEATNPSPVSRRVTEVRFVYIKRLPPEKLFGAIELQKIVFEQTDFDQTTKTFRKILNGLEMPANGNLNLQFFVRNPKYKDHRLLGRLEVYFDDRNDPHSIGYDNYTILCVE